MRYLAPLLVLMLLGALTAPSPSSAQAYGPRAGVQSGEVRSLGEILDDVRRERPGSLADVQGPNIGPRGEARYRLKWVSPNGRVQWLDTDARTGRVLGAQGAAPGRPPGPGPAINPNPGPRRGAAIPGRQNFNAPVIGMPPPGRGAGFARGPQPGFGRGPGQGPGFGRGGPPPNRGPGGAGNRFRQGR